MLQTKEFACAKRVKTVEDIALQNKQNGRIFMISAGICLLGWQFISYSLVYVTFFSLIKHERVRTYVFISQFSTKISTVQFSLFLKNYYSYFRVTFSKTPWLLTYFYVVAEVNDFGRIYTSLVAQR